MPRGRQRFEAASITAQSIAARSVAKELLGRTPAQEYEARLKASYKDLIGEPFGEPGRSDTKIDRKSGKPRGYSLQKVLGLEHEGAMYAHYQNIIQKHAGKHLDISDTYSAQRRTSVTLVASKTLLDIPIFHLYDDYWPVHAFLKLHLKSKVNKKRKIDKKLEQEAAGPDANPGNDIPHREQDPPAGEGQPAPIQPPLAANNNNSQASNTPSNTPRTTGHNTTAQEIHRSIQNFDPDPDPNTGDSLGKSDGELTPPASPLPPRKRGRGDPDRNVPRVQTRRTAQLATTAEENGNTPEDSPPRPATRRQTKASKKNPQGDTNAEAGPGPSTMSMAKRKELVRSKAKS